MAFHCQNCKAPIALDESLRNLLKAQTQFLLLKTGKPAHQPHLAPQKYIPPDRLALATQAIAESDEPIIFQDYSKLTDSGIHDLQTSYVFLSDAEDDQDSEIEELPNDPYSGEDQLPDFSKINSLNQVFEILSTNEDVSHPMCAECSHLLTANYKLKFDQRQREKELYLAFLKKLKLTELTLAAQNGSQDGKLNESHAEFEELKALESEKLRELQELEQKHDDLAQQLQNLNEELDSLNSNELNDIIKLKNSLSMELQLKQSKLDQAKTLYQKHLNHLDQLRALNIYTKLFAISFDESNHAKINGFRLGHRIAWPEINVALGQIVLLLQLLKKRFDVDLEPYKLVPFGSKLYIIKKGSTNTENGERTKTSSVLQLYSLNEFSLGKLFNFNKLDVSMIALLEIVSLFSQKLTSLDEELALPYEISAKHDLIGGKSIRVTSNGQWTESCRYLLINLNWMLTYASTRS